ncbi:ATP phosphoribosyltransferase regulatory subunit [Roseivivax halotolerans]|jgi:ATP phosphoribosyltransferase regulatory subunit|uniref:ATP phosphoribosyltransferase regulatory subunit n=1 Tax=Roseivivax halotolerans TaxID=93684 RepID=A0A1I5YSI9_9RHOB|nr:ATP phosphoribosyltransferase regulatory subunit [Roseivivax halotolerans]SFQ47238.1 ATP phosphoribosyltransferase regulatory subunit [Roseivivax halotolerans]
MTTRAARERALELRGIFEAAGAAVVECDILQPAETLLDLYGEDIRARAYVTQDPARGERMLRPDFTVPVVQMHMAGGAEPARYTYAGEVFRRQEDHPGRASEYLQVGFELFDRTDPEAADAEVFCALQSALEGLPLRAATGDIGILMAAVAGLGTSEARRAALLRHIWRPRRFRQLLNRFSGKSPLPESRRALLAEADPMACAAPIIGLRDREEIAARIEALRADADEPPIARGEVEMIDELLSVAETCPFAIDHLKHLGMDHPPLRAAVDRFERRCDALAARGVNVDILDFEAAYGRTSMEYYDGFVFGFYAERRPDLPPVATGGRYDALTARLGQGESIPAVGGVIRPDILSEIGGEP